METEPHVFHLHSSAGVYGAEYVLLGLIPALARHGVRSTLLCLDNPLHEKQALFTRAQELGVPAERVQCGGRFDLATVRAVRGKLSGAPNTLLHVHGYKSAFYGWLGRMGGATPVIATLHGSIPNSVQLRIYARVEQLLLRRFDRLCIVAEAMRGDLIRSGVPAARIRLIENGIDTDRFRPGQPPLSRADLGIPANAFLFGAAMRLAEEKNPFGLIDAFAAVAKRSSEAWLAIAGDGPLRGDMEARVRQAGLEERVRFLGARDDLEHYYPTLDCFVLPSLYEGLPLALLEAMAAERNVVSTDVGQIREVVKGLPATLVAPSNIGALASAMKEALDTRHPPRPELRQRVCERYSCDRMAQEYAQVYRDLWRSHGYAFA